MECIGYHPDTEDDRFFDGYPKIHHMMYICPVCAKVTLATAESHYDYRFDHTFVDYVRTLYPCLGIDFTNVPISIKGAYESAVKIRGMDPYICFMALRRALEMICREKGEEDNLDQMVTNLIKKKVLPESFKEVCDIIRLCGNRSAHGNSVNTDDLEAVIGYVGTIIEYLYSLPHSIEVRLKNLKTLELDQNEPLPKE